MVFFLSPEVPQPTFRLSVVCERRVPGGIRVSVLSALPLSCHPLPHMPRIPSGNLATEKHTQAFRPGTWAGETKTPRAMATQRQVSPGRLQPSSALWPPGTLDLWQAEVI